MLGVDRLSIELKCQASDRIENVKTVIGTGCSTVLITESSKVQEELKLYEKIRAITAIG